MQRIDAAEQGLVHEDGVAVLGEDRRHLALDRLKRVVRMCAGEVEEHAADPLERAPAALEGGDRVLEGRFRRTPGDLLHLGALLRKRRIEGGAEMLRPDGLEGRKAERRGPVAAERIAGKGRLRCRHEGLPS